jgi:hypothetical protein
MAFRRTGSCSKALGIVLAIGAPLTAAAQGFNAGPPP